MSASLVGSEMCIRDRLSCRFPHAPAAFCAHLWGLGFQQMRNSCARTPFVCLLYTSDAADDM
eukprot:6606417-Alexandrium_andersonii.AAC.1